MFVKLSRLWFHRVSVALSINYDDQDEIFWTKGPRGKHHCERPLPTSHWAWISITARKPLDDGIVWYGLASLKHALCLGTFRLHLLIPHRGKFLNCTRTSPLRMEPRAFMTRLLVAKGSMESYRGSARAMIHVPGDRQTCAINAVCHLADIDLNCTTVDSSPLSLYALCAWADSRSSHRLVMYFSLILSKYPIDAIMRFNCGLIMSPSVIYSSYLSVADMSLDVTWLILRRATQKNSTPFSTALLYITRLTVGYFCTIFIVLKPQTLSLTLSHFYLLLVVAQLSKCRQYSVVDYPWLLFSNSALMDLLSDWLPRFFTGEESR